MKNFFRISVGCTALMMVFVCCKQEYIPQLKEKNVKLLVVEGFLNSGQGPTKIRLSRTVNLTDVVVTKAEVGAQVRVEGENGNSFILTGNPNGEYSIAQLALTNNIKYRLWIKTTDGKEYVSDFTPVKYTPPIDSLTWKRESDGVRLYVNTHDPQNATKYYQWEYEETWEFRSSFQSSVKYIRDNTNRIIAMGFKYTDHSVDTTIYKCWKTVNSTSIILGSSERLTADVIYLPFHFLEQGSEKLSILYSINLKQNAISHEKYLFLEKMKKNTEQLGSLFDPQPTQLSGNIHCMTDPNEIVIGFVEISQQQIKRKFIYNYEVSNWNYVTGCFEKEIDNIRDSLEKYGEGLTPTTPSLLSPNGSIIKSYATPDPGCVDCTIGRSNQKPSFWP